MMGESDCDLRKVVQRKSRLAVKGSKYLSYRGRVQWRECVTPFTRSRGN